MAGNLCLSRLRKEYKELQKKPVENIEAAPLESNILEWHYIIVGPSGSPYFGGVYHGILTFPSTYPMKPPSIQMLTPNGRFKPSTRLCLSMSDYHPESWNPMWSVGTILMGLYSFMLEDTPTTGSISTSTSYKIEAARQSMEFNYKDKKFCELFPEMIEKYEKSLETPSQPEAIVNTEHVTTGVDATQMIQKPNPSWTTVLGLLAAVIACTWAILKLAV